MNNFLPVFGGDTPWYKTAAYLADGIAPSMVMDFRNNRYASNGSARALSNLATTTRASTATYFNASGVLTTAAINEPRFDYDYLTQNSLGILIEEQRTNSVQNSTMVGASTSPSTFPTTWTSGAVSGLTHTIVATGTLPNGMAYVDIRVNGTATAASQGILDPMLNNAQAGSNGQTWTASGYFALVGGAWPSSANGIILLIVGRNSSQTGVESSATNFKTTVTDSTLRRVTGTYTLTQATVAYAQYALRYATVLNEVIDFTIRVAAPQFELGGNASSFIPTSTVAVTRAADLISKTGIASMVTRATTGTYTDKNGYLATASINAPRYNYTSPTTASLLMESASTNYLLYSNNFSVVSWTGISLTITAAATTGPDNTASGTKIEINDTTSIRQVNQIIGSSAGYVASIWIKGGTTTNVSVGMYDTTGSAWNAGVGDSTCRIISGPGTISPVYTGGSLYTISGLSTSQWTKIETYRASSTNRLIVYPNLSAQAVGDNLYLYGAQVEIGARSTSYIPTTNAAVTRAADTRNTEALEFMNFDAFTLYAEATNEAINNVSNRTFSFTDGTANNIAHLANALGAPGTIVAQKKSAGGTTYQPTGVTSVYNTYRKQVASMDNTDVRFYLAGTEYTATGSGMPTITTMGIGQTLNANVLSGHIKELRVYPVKLSTSEAQRITT